jgi:uncharacterized membrane protein YeaQ/YmgE (transglycosylase-associated protein family)
MSIVSWSIVGMLAGFVSSWIVKRQDSSVSLDIVLGAVGATAAGIVYETVIARNGRDAWTLGLFISLAGAVLVLAGYHGLKRRHVF